MKLVADAISQEMKLIIIVQNVRINLNFIIIIQIVMRFVMIIITLMNRINFIAMNLVMENIIK